MVAAPAALSPVPATDLAEHAVLLLERLRDERTRVHAITNAAAQVLTANLLLAAGGVPSLTIAPDEIASFAARADALLVNLGTLDTGRRAAIPWAVATGRAQHKPWVLDPVFVDVSQPRREFARLCLTGSPCVLRCNAPEFAALSGREASVESVRDYARELGSVIALTGPVDWVTDGERFLSIENGHPLMARVTAMGCAATVLIAAFTALADDHLLAAACGLLAVGVAGEIAGEGANGPGSFQPAFLDVLANLDRPTLSRRARIA